MDIETYKAGWERASPIMAAALDAVREHLQAFGLTVEAPVQAGDEEWRLDCLIKREGTLAGAIEFTLHEDEDQDGSDQFGVGCRLFGPEAEVHGGWTPYAYTEKAYTSLDVVIERLKDFPPIAFAEFVAKELAVKSPSARTI